MLVDHSKLRSEFFQVHGKTPESDPAGFQSFSHAKANEEISNLMAKEMIEGAEKIADGVNKATFNERILLIVVMAFLIAGMSLFGQETFIIVLAAAFPVAPFIFYIFKTRRGILRRFTKVVIGILLTPVALFCFTIFIALAREEPLDEILSLWKEVLQYFQIL